MFAGHDANLAFGDTEKGEYHVIEIERLAKHRYFRLHVDNNENDINSILHNCSLIANDLFKMNGPWDVFSVPMDGGLIDINLIKRSFDCKRVESHNHHMCHAAGAYYQSPFFKGETRDKRALIISYDGGGNDGHFNVFSGHPEYRISPLINIPSDFGGGYLLLGSSCSEVGKNSRHQLALSGKLMGLCAYGETNEKDVSAMRPFFIDKDYKKLSESLSYDLKNVDAPWDDPLNNYIFEGQDSFNHAANTQKAFEEQFLEIFDQIINEYPIPNNVILTGGCALNVLLNQRIKDSYPDLNLFVPPDPSDCGLALGCLFSTEPPKEHVNIAYKGVPILDDATRFKTYLFKGRDVQPLDLDYVCKLLKEGKIIGVCRGDSEVGPRALGNRSIICDPSIKDMKDILNAKVKFREWYRPFAPFCLKSEASTYFESRDFENMEFMGYAPRVKEEYKDKLPSITHADGSARLQTVTEESHKFFYDLLQTYSKYSDTHVLLNTSFNIRGLPILTKIDDALDVLDNTQMDALIINDQFIEK